MQNEGYELQVAYGAAGTTVVPPFEEARKALLYALAMPEVDGYRHKVSSITIRLKQYAAEGSRTEGK